MIVALHKPENYRLRAQQKAANLTSAYPRVQGSVGIIPVNGPTFHSDDFMAMFYGGATYGQIVKTLGEFEQNPDVKAIILDVNSPGGDVAGVFELSERIRESSKPVIAYVGALAASAGYLLAASARKIVAHSSAYVGSVGVYHCEYSDGGNVRYVASDESPLKLADLTTPEGEAAIKARVNEMASMIIDTLAAYRGVERANVVSDFGRGDIVNAKNALQSKMVDVIGSFKDAWALALGETSPNSGPTQPTNVGTAGSLPGGRRLRTMARKNYMKAGLVLVDSETVPAETEMVEVTVDTIKQNFPEIYKQIEENVRGADSEAMAEVEEVAEGANPENADEMAAVAQARARKITAAQLAKTLVSLKAKYANSEEAKKKALAAQRDADTLAVHTVGGGEGGTLQKVNYAKAALKKHVYGGK